MIKNPVLSQKAFTLLELMIAIIIIGILAAAGLVTYSTSQKSARISKRSQDLQAIQQAVELFRNSTGHYPSIPSGTAPASGEGATTNWFCLTSLAGSNSLTPTYMPVIPADPLGGSNCYQYTSDNVDIAGTTPAATEYKIRTYGSLSTSEMSYINFNTLISLLDPAHDTITTNGCTIDPLTANYTNQAWALYTNGACGW